MCGEGTNCIHTLIYHDHDHGKRQREESTKKGEMRRTYIEHDDGGVMRQVQEPRCGHREDYKTKGGDEYEQCRHCLEPPAEPV